MNTQQKKLLSIVLFIAVMGTGISYYNNKANEEALITLPVSSTVVSSTVSVADSSTVFAATSTKPNVNKTISASITYDVPDNYKNIITVNLILENDIIKDISHTEKAGDETSQMIYDNFSKNLNKAGIIGKKISEVSLSKVGGASLTTKAFMQSLNKLSQM